FKNLNNQAILGRNEAENISRVLYPIESAFEGKELQLKQEYFLVSATLQDILYQFKSSYPTYELFELPNKVVIHINDTHPALAIPELLRILVDIECMDWIDAWDICSRVFTHTNHVSQVECLKYWPLDMLQRVLPRHVEIIRNIDYHFKSGENNVTRGFINMGVYLLPHGETQQIMSVFFFNFELALQDLLKEETTMEDKPKGINETLTSECHEVLEHNKQYHKE
ncbi:unnamed protein product, partial [Schistosoma curassoni]|uniref:Alpha-1,4 glucan phosphorylase n=1 Tax=Schistosoma curassoni TaxID=6186 RepID=A0A183KQ28_9TREM